ncbi:hypothetical protein KPL71_001021 [Citrus sinensis]|uniref:Uncharacterized protein n=1 Tax=Citrus sinensis TaxID=2711 RepID=A0ACB8NUN6_CITSI|nr:hypothetical protein KPL71_001021 [Citrus sinensis]
MDGGVVLRCWEEWLTGAYAGYTVDCLRESEGMLWVGESEHENDKVASGMTMWNHIQPAYAANMLMGSQHHMYCVPFVLEMYKEAGLFDPIASSIRATEFTVKDAYLVRFFENNSSRLPKWCNDADTVKLPNCQIRGKYRLELPVYNVLDPYPNMNERTGSGLANLNLFSPVANRDWEIQWFGIC